MKYWSPSTLLPYNRNFNFINSSRGIGKTYNMWIFLLNRALNNCDEFVYIVRTQNDKQEGRMRSAAQKVLNEQFPDLPVVSDNNTMWLESKNGQVLGHCLALSEAYKAKRSVSLPNVKWLFFDEYILEGGYGYVHGWKEPDLLLNLYHTIDREKDKVVCFMCANTVSFYNPYHLHPAFAIPQGKPGKIWHSENVLFQWAEPSAELQEQKSNCKFLRMIDGTGYGRYAKDGQYIEDKTALIDKRPVRAKLRFNVLANDETFGVWYDADTQIYYIDNKCNLAGMQTYVASIEEHLPGAKLLRIGGNLEIMLFSNAFKEGQARFTSMEVQAKCLSWIHKLV